MQLSELKSLHVGQLLEMAIANEIEAPTACASRNWSLRCSRTAPRRVSRSSATASWSAARRLRLPALPDTSYLAGTDDIYVSPSQIRRFNLHTGDTVEGEIRTPRRRALFRAGEGRQGQLRPPEAAKHKILFENLTPLHPRPVPQAGRDIRRENITGSA